MISPNEMAAIERAINAARYEIERQEMELKDKQSLIGGFLFPSDEKRAASVARDMLEQAIRQRNFIMEGTEPRHEEALQIVEICNKIATPGWVYQVSKQPTLTEKLSAFGKAIADKAIHNPLTGALFGPWIKILIVVIGLGAVAYILSFVPRKK